MPEDSDDATKVVEQSKNEANLELEPEEIKTGVREKKDPIQLDDGSTYDGQWVDGKRDG